jgi:hypothetical protein
MEEKEFVALVDELEGYARQNPGAYKLRVALLAALGYVFLLGIVLIVLFLVLAVIYFGRINFLVIKILLIPLGLAAIVLRSLWVEFPVPEGQSCFTTYANSSRRFRTRDGPSGPEGGPPFSAGAKLCAGNHQQARVV